MDSSLLLRAVAWQVQKTGRKASVTKTARMLLPTVPIMYSTPVPWLILSSTVGAGVLTEGWNLAETAAGDDESRAFSCEVLFATPFSAPPVVQVGLTGFDIDQRDSPRVTVKAERITEFGFHALIATWATTRVYAVEFSWVAIGP